MDLRSRFLDKVEKTETCWLWQANTDSSGYGCFSVNGLQVGAHRVSYELFVKPIPDGLSIDHSCRVRRCVNPDHLTPMTLRENRAKAQAELRREVRGRGACRNGHPYTEDSIYERNGTWFCRPCNAASQRRRKQRLRQQAAVTAPVVSSSAVPTPAEQQAMARVVTDRFLGPAVLAVLTDPSPRGEGKK